MVCVSGAYQASSVNFRPVVRLAFVIATTSDQPTRPACVPLMDLELAPGNGSRRGRTRLRRRPLLILCRCRVPPIDPHLPTTHACRARQKSRRLDLAEFMRSSTTASVSWLDATDGAFVCSPETVTTSPNTFRTSPRPFSRWMCVPVSLTAKQSSLTTGGWQCSI